MASILLISHLLFVMFFFEVQDLFLPIGPTFVGFEYFGQLLFFVLLIYDLNISYIRFFFFFCIVTDVYIKMSYFIDHVSYDS